MHNTENRAEDTNRNTTPKHGDYHSPDKDGAMHAGKPAQFTIYITYY